MVVTDAQIDKALVSLPDYQKDGKFSEELYRNTPAADRFRSRQQTKTQLLIQYYVNDRTQGALVSDDTKNFIAAMAYPQRKFSFVTFTDADFPLTLVSDYALKNKNLFRTIDVSKITVNSEGDAQKVREEAVKGDKTFADLAKTYSKDSQTEAGGALGVKRYYDLKSEITKTADLDKLFSLTAGAISPVITGDKVWAIYKVNTAAADADVTTADTLAVVRAYIAKSERGLLEDNLEAQAKDFSAAAKVNFAAAAKKINKTPETSGWVALNFGNHDLFPSLTASSKNSVFRGLAANEDFFKQTFRLEAGQVSGPILASPAVLVVKADEVKTAPAKEDTPVLPTSVESSITQERSQALEKVILASPKLEDHFQAEFEKIRHQ
jgi:parvulin-like peptidyl-prolyl isomerase